MEYKFKYKYVKMAPRKVRLVVDLVRKMSPNEAITQLKFLSKAAAKPVSELIKSAVSSCKNNNITIDKLSIKSLTCNAGPTLKRRRYKSKGRADSIKKRTSHIHLILSEKTLVKKQLKNKSKSFKKPNLISKNNKQ